LETVSENTLSPKASPFLKLWIKLSWVQNKYLISTVFFIAWMVFIDRNDLPTQWKRVKELKSLQQSERNMENQINNTKKELGLLKTSPFTLEKYAREKYMMKRDNEDLYIISSAKQ